MQSKIPEFLKIEFKKDRNHLTKFSDTIKKRNKCKWNATKKLGYNFKVEIR